MGKRTVITCDKCGKEWDESDKTEQPVALSLKLDFGSTNIPHNNIYAGRRLYSAIWCRECIMKNGIYKPITNEDKAVAPNPKPAIEDKIVEILNDLGFYQSE